MESKFRALQIAVRIRAAHQLEQVVFAPFARRTIRHNLLRQDIPRTFRNFQAIQIARADGAHQRGALDQLIARRGEETPFRPGSHPMPRSPDPLKRDRDGTRRSDLADQVDRADIDSQFERSGGHHGPQVSAFEPAFRVEPQRARQAAMVRQHNVFAETFAERVCHSFGQAARIHEHQRGAVRENQLRHPVVNFGPHLVACHRAKFVTWNLDSEIHGAAMTDVDDARLGAQEPARLPRLASRWPTDRCAGICLVPR